MHSVFEAVEGEFLEFREAVKREQYDGPHGIASEALQLAVVALKAHLFHTNRPPAISGRQ